MRHLFLVVIRCQRAAKCSGCVSLHDHNIRALPLDYCIQSLDRTRRNLRKALRGKHQSQVVIRLKAENWQNLVDHLTMLPSCTNKAAKGVAALLKLQNNWRQLDSFWARSDNG